MKFYYKFFKTVVFFIISFQLSFNSAAQESFYYHNSHRVPLQLSKNKIIIKFTESTEKAFKKQLIGRYENLKPLSDDHILQAPDISIVNLKDSLTDNDLFSILQSLEGEEFVEYANPFYLYPVDSIAQGIINQFVVKLKSPENYEDLISLCTKTNTTLAGKDEYTEGIYILSADKHSAGNALEMANRFYETGLFEFSEPDFLRILTPLASVNDAYFNYQWGLKNTGSAIQYNGTIEADMDVDNAWDITTGSSSVRVAIIDEGVDLAHPDLTANLVSGYDGTGLGSSGGPSGNDAHGTNCAGIVAASGNNTIGVAGIAYNCKIVPVRIAYGSGGGWVTTNTWIANSINWSWNNAKADVLSNSWGGGSASSLINTAISNAQTYGRNGLGCVVLFAAGNSNNAVIYPGSLSNVIAVAAMSMCNQRKNPTSCDGENWGSCYGTDLDVAAPGVKIASTDISGSAGYRSGDYNMTFNGTSSATPNVAGVAALMLSVNSGLTYTQAREILEKTCQKVGSYTYSTVSGHDNGSWCTDLGYGMVNAFEAVKEAMIYADIPYSTGFETGTDKYWEFENTTTYGRIQVSSSYSPHSGSNHLLMDVSSNNQVDTNKAMLKLNLAGKHKVKLSFWWKDINDEYNAKDGIYLSNNKGRSYKKIYDLNSNSSSYQQVLLDISKLADSFGLALTDKTIIKFQHQDDSSLTNDGFAFDDIYVSGYQADLTVKNTAANPVNVARDSSTSVGCKLINLGSWPADSSVIAFYLSADSIFDVGDVQLSTSKVGIIQSKDTVNISKSLHIPLNTNPGTAYILFIADANNNIADSIESNNRSYKQINIISYPPVVTVHPISQSIIIGDNMNLTVTSVGASTLSYQWQKNNSNISGATSSYYTKNNLGYNDSGYYRCIVSNSYGKDTSDAARIQVVNTINMCSTTSTVASSGIVYDPGGPSLNYGDELNCGLLINPLCADTIKLSFSSFSLETNYDYLYVYDGKDISGTLLLTATGTSIPSNVVATSGSMYLLFISDAYVTAAGFSATWTTAKTSLKAGFSVNDSSQCLRGNAFNLTNSSTINSGSYTSFWKFGDNTTSTSISPSKSYSSAGNYSIKLITTSNKGCKDSISKNAFVRPHPVSAFSINDTSQCLRGNSFVFTNGSGISSGTYTNLWKFGDNTTSTSASPSKSYSGYGMYAAKLITTSNYNCKDSISKNVYVRPHPVSAYSINDTSQCLRGNSFVFTNGSGISSGTYSNLWKFGDNTTSTAASPSKSFSGYGMYAAKLITTSNYNCKDSISKNMYVRPHPVTAFSINDTSQCLRGNSFVFTNGSGISSGTYSNFWKFGDNTTSTAASPSKSYSGYGMYAAKLITTSNYNCKDSISKNVYVRPHPVSAFSINDTSQCLRVNSFVFTNGSGISSGTYTNLWKFGDNTTSTATSPSKSYSGSGMYAAKLITTSNYNCKDSISKNVYLRPHPVSAFSINDTSQCLRGNSFVFTNGSGISTGNFSNLWNFGDNTNSANISPTKSYFTTGSFTVKLLTTSDFGCKDSIIKNIFVRPNPSSSFSINDSSQCLRGNSFSFTNTSSISSGSFTDIWHFGDNTTSASSSPVKSYSNIGTQAVKLITTSNFGCKDSSSKNVFVRPHPSAMFSVNDSSQCLRGNSFIFTNNSIISSGSFSNSWNFGDLTYSTGFSPAKTFSKGGQYAVKLLTTSVFGCSDSISRNIYIREHPLTSFSVNDSIQCERGNSFDFINQSAISSGNFTNFWSFGDSNFSTLTAPIHQYTGFHYNTFTVKLVTTSDYGCKDSTWHTVSLLPTPDAQFSLNDDKQCLGINSFRFNNNSFYWYGSGTALWDFGNGDVSKIYSPQYSYQTADTFTVMLKITSDSGCTDTFTGSVIVFPQPQAGYYLFSGNHQCLHNNLFSPVDASTINNDTISTYYWDFGDAYSSNLKNPSHSYTVEDTYTIKQIVASSHGCLDSMWSDVYVYPMPEPAFTINDTNQCFSGNLFSFTNTSAISSGKLGYIWYTGDGYSSYDSNLKHSYDHDGNYTIKLISFSEHSCIDSFIKTITVRKTPVVKLGNDTTLFDNQKLVLDAGLGYDTYFWSNLKTTRSITVDTSGIGLSTKLFWVRVLLDRCPGTDSINVTFIEYISIKDKAGNLDIRVYPNPATDLLQIETGPLSKELIILLTDLNGKTIRTMHQKPSTDSNSLQTDISGLAKGMYYLTFTNNEVRKTVKFIKN